MEPPTLRKAGSKQEEAFGVQPRRVADLGTVPSLWRSNSSLRKVRRSQNLFGNSEKQESLSSWIPENIKKKECMYFVESSKLSDAGKVVCECGYTRQQHLEEATRPHTWQGKDWDPKKHVQEMPTDAFGDIVFTGLGQKVGKYVRLSQDTPPSVIYHLMTQYWGLDVPNLLISVTGGAKDFNMKPRLKSVFRRGLVKVAQTTGAWIITGGSHTGVMKQVGEAVRDFTLSSSHNEGEVVTVGVATWGTVHNREDLIHPSGGFPAEYVMDEEGQGHLTCLDSNHSHFILVDDGTHGRYGVEIPLRTRLEKFISEQTKERGGVAIKIPIVCVVLEGGPGTLHTIYNAITNGTPCVVVEGSGRVADVIAQVAGLPISEVTISRIQQKLSVFFQEVFETLTESRIAEWTKKIQDIVRRRQLLTIFREGKDGQQDVDVAILQALLKASRSHDHFGHENWDHQLKLAVAWNRVDIARSEIFTDERQWKPSELHPVMTAALISNKPEFVKLFLENGVRLKELVTWDTLLYLYQNLDPSCLFHSKLQKVLADEPERPVCVPPAPRVQMHHVAQVLRELLGDFTQPLYPRPRTGDRPRLLLPVPNIKLNVQGVSLRSLYKRSPGHVAFTMDPVRDLLIWAIIQNRRELAEIIWAQSQDCIAAALACSKILKELSKEEEDTDSLEEMLALADEYEHRAIGVFTECHRKDEDRAQKLLTRVSEAWGKTTCLQLALEAKDMKFVSHGGVQAFLTKVWWGQLCVDNGLWRVIVCMLAFPLLYTGLISFRERRLQAGPGLPRVRAFFNAPVVIFHLNILSYFAFLCLFAYVLMVDFQPTPSCCEYLIYFWLFSLVCEELRQLFYDPDEFGLMKMALLYFSDFWNKLDIGAILLFIAGLTCRLIPALLYPGRIILSLDFIMFCLRLMHIFTISKTLGPKIIIVKRMMKDVFFFLFLLAVWVVSFGVAKQAILIHNESRVDWIFRGVVYQSYLTIFGQMPAYIDGVNFSLDQCSPNGTDPYKPKCPESDAVRHEPAFPEWLTVILLCLYLLFTNILLLNLLIAMFNYTFQQVQEHTDQIWKFQRHDLIEEYQGRPPAPPPFILLSHLHLFIKRVVLKIPARRRKQLKSKLEKNEEAALLSWEIYLKESYLQNQQYQQKQRPEQKIQDIGNKVSTMVDLLEMESLKQRLASLEEQVAQTSRALHWVMKALRDGGFGSEEGIPAPAPQKASEGQDLEPDGRQEEEDVGDTHHVNARHLLYPNSHVTRFPVPNEKVPWERSGASVRNQLQRRGRTHRPAELPRGLRGSGRAPSEPHGPHRTAWTWKPRLLWTQPHAAACDHPVEAQPGWSHLQEKHKENARSAGRKALPLGTLGLARGKPCKLSVQSVCPSIHPTQRRNTCSYSPCPGQFWTLSLVLKDKPGSREPGEILPRKLKQVLRREFWSSFQNLLTQGTEDTGCERNHTGRTRAFASGFFHLVQRLWRPPSLFILPRTVEAGVDAKPETRRALREARTPRYTEGTWTTQGTRTTPGLRPWPSASTSQTRATWT
ncbi:transient receptor potential cation channel subfamily M member 2 isoform X1 [Lynx canadensis]|uniref:transient receptor potential cation channel subfamily M member 2 isoform X1 n=2 Tax=Lynx canadensis TaxID=61383 RepID=UPI0011B05136|nr:transient receptor potential cation channel subfamily M member 2 isoform X1 [Lynx canadensis]XP_030184619.1 transient receptor potential cation channel subfamily M member 2 isoform X1 [Lynx canadensis]XP_030184620.1 transient receptor potential cation channel subfamily M member 2 isoform X1 [Lynx canadensis]XP_030184621.1 transient receptor potential cation channel subfamily M member 2 isoform X1 [Lynx canadensis]XP_030184622.1 transient receptor potential cation channel subfamily M member 2